MTIDRDLLERALTGNAAAMRTFVAAVMPIVQARVARTLARRRAGSGRDVRQEVEDISQEVFAALFENDARVLRAWDPSRGLALPSFCGLVAEREASSILRSGKRSPWKEDPTASEDLEQGAGEASGTELRVATREHLDRLVERLREELSPLGLEMFQRLVVDEESVESVCAATSMKPDAVYAWRSRLGKLARKLAAELVSSDPALVIGKKDVSGGRGSPRRTDEGQDPVGMGRGREKTS